MRLSGAQKPLKQHYYLLFIGSAKAQTKIFWQCSHSSTIKLLYRNFYIHQFQVTIFTDAVGKLDLTLMRLSPFPCALSVLNSFTAFLPRRAYPAYPSYDCIILLFAKRDLRLFYFGYQTVHYCFFFNFVKKKG
jgi:hypothetical protein